MKPQFEASIDVRKCCEYLTNKTRVSYSELSRHLGRQVNGRDRYILDSARRILENQHGIVFVVERGVGLVRAGNGQISRLSTDHAIVKIRRTTRKATKRQTLVDIQQLSTDERLAFSVGRVVIEAISKNTLKSFRSQIAKEIEKRDGELVTVNQLMSLPRHRK